MNPNDYGWTQEDRTPISDHIANEIGATGEYLADLEREARDLKMNDPIMFAERIAYLDREIEDAKATIETLKIEAKKYIGQ